MSTAISDLAHVPQVPMSPAERIASTVLFIAILATLFVQSQSLYTTPTQDSYRWYGDESWMTSVWKEQASTAAPRYPEALGATISHTVGFLSGAEWLNCLVYGVPLAVGPSNVNHVVVGRTVTFLVSVGMLSFVGWYLLRHGVPASIALASTALLVATKSFFYASHSARYDIITGLLVAAVVLYFDDRYRRSMQSKKWLGIGFALTLTAFVVGGHPLVLLAPFGIYLLIQARAFASPKRILLALFGCVAAFASLISMYALRMGSFSIFGDPGVGNQYFSVTSSFPILHLFSRSAQMHQLWARGFYVRTQAPQFFGVLAVIAIAMLPTLRRSSPRFAANRFLLGAVCSVLFGALFLENMLPNYLIHVFPLIVVLFAFQMDAALQFFPRIAMPTVWAVGLFAVLLLMYNAVWTVKAASVGNVLTHENTVALDSCAAAILRNSPPNTRPLVLAQAPALATLGAHPNLRMMTESFLMFPVDTSSPASILRARGVDFAVYYHYPLTTKFDNAVTSLGTPLLTFVGHFVDRNQDYDSVLSNRNDTLTLYQFHWK